MRAALAVAALLAGCTARPEAELVVLAGQSNALGYLTAADLPDDLRRPDPAVRIWRQGGFETLQPGRNTGSANRRQSWGPEAGFARAWRAAHPDRPLYLVKVARGSTSLAPTEGLDWAPSSGELFAQTAAEVAAAKAALASEGLKPHVSAILWVQGEADAVDPAAAQTYQANLSSLIKAMREQWSGPDARVVLARIPDFGGHAAQVRAAQKAVDDADMLTVSVDTQGLPMQSDGLHIAAEGQARLGEAFFAAAESLSR